MTQLTREELYWFALKKYFGKSDSVLKKEYLNFGSLIKACCLKSEGLARKDGSIIGEDELAEACGKAENEIEALNREGIGVLFPASELYPKLLLDIYDPPAVLYYRGKPELLLEPKISMVGSRKYSVYGMQAATKLAEIFSAYGLCVVSGMARGIDYYSHIGAIGSGDNFSRGKTIAVLGSGIDVPYPRENYALYQRLCAQHLVISELGPGIQPERYYFPKRNRIIAALSPATVVVEAGEKSGSIITASQALEQGRDVYCVPGSIFRSDNSGANELIKEGAGLICSLTDASEIACGILKTDYTENKIGARASAGEYEKFEWLLKNISEFGSTPEEIAKLCDTSADVVAAALSELLLRGIVTRASDGRVIINY